jgi:hypothetical protein
MFGSAQRRYLVCSVRSTLDQHGNLNEPAIHRNSVGECGGNDAGNGRNLLEDVVLRSRKTFRLAAEKCRDPDARRLQFLGANESGISATKVRIINPELTRSTRARATCTTTSAFRVLWWRRLAVAPREPTPSAPIEDACRSAGREPNNRLESSEAAIAKPITIGSSEISCRRGKLVGPSVFRTASPA